VRVLLVAVALVAAVVLASYRYNLLGINPPAAAPSPSAQSVTHQPSGYKVDAIELYLMPMQRVEYKYTMAKDATMIWSWTADKTTYYDMHNVPEGKPLSASERIEEGNATEAHGVYTAPYPGLHGWFWENRQNEEILITLKTAGFYTAAVMISDDEQTPMPLQDPPPPIEP
jgi:hypothetical protein